MSWPTIALGEAVTFKGGGTPSRNNASFWGGRIPWATVKDFSSGYSLRFTQESITEDGLRGSASNLIPAGTVVIPTRMALGKAAIAEADIAINQDLKAVFPTRDLDSRFLLWYFIANSSRIEAMGKGATVKGVTLDQLRSLDLPMPPLAEQRRIAAILDKADTLCARRREAIAKLDRLLQSLFIEMFGDPMTNPKDWPVRTLAEISRGISDIDHKMPAAVKDGLPFISAKDLTDDSRISFENVKRISEADFQRLSRKGRPEKGDIIYSRIGVIGKARVVEVDFPFLASYSCCTIKLNREFVETNYLCSLLESPFMLTQAHKGVRAIAVPDLGLGEIRAFKVVLPPLSLQHEFSERAVAIKDLKAAQSASLAALERLTATLQHRAFSGAS